MNSLASCVSAPRPSATKPISCPPTPAHAQQAYCPNCSPNKSQSFVSPNHTSHHHGSHQTISQSHASHMAAGYGGGNGGYVSSSPTKGISHAPSIQAGSVVGGSHVGLSPSFVTSYKPGPSLSSKFVDHGCSLSESSFTESCANFPTTLQSNV